MFAISSIECKRKPFLIFVQMEYERYLVERSPHWQQQFKERTQAAQRKVQHALISHWNHFSLIFLNVEVLFCFEKDT